MNTKTLGDLAELKAALYFAEQGYVVSKPIGDNAPYDLIVDKDNKLQKVQVKARSERNGVISVEMRSCMRNYTYFYTRDDFDILAAYNADSGKMAFLTWDDIGDKQGVALRTTPPKNGQKKGVMMMEDYAELR